MTKDSGQADAVVYRGITLPVGMTPLCLDELANLISAYERDELESPDDDYVSAGVCAAMAFRLVSRHLTFSDPLNDRS